MREAHGYILAAGSREGSAGGGSCRLHHLAASRLNIGLHAIAVVRPKALLRLGRGSVTFFPGTLMGVIGTCRGVSAPCDWKTTTCRRSKGYCLARAPFRKIANTQVAGERVRPPRTVVPTQRTLRRAAAVKDAYRACDEAAAPIVFSVAAVVPMAFVPSTMRSARRARRRSGPRGRRGDRTTALSHEGRGRAGPGGTGRPAT
jgi:hypothetical protein